MLTAMLRALLLASFLSIALGYCPSDYTYNPGTQKCYKFVTYQMATFWLAQLDCTHDGGNLVQIENAFENSYLYSQLRSVEADDCKRRLSSTQMRFYIGYSRLVSGYGPYSWTSGNGSTYSNWYQGFPGTNGDTAYIDMTTNGFWKNLNGESVSNFYICSMAPFTSVVCPKQLRCEDGWTLFSKTSSCYKAMYSGATFNRAVEVCQAASAQLTSIHSEEENIFVTQLPGGCNVINNDGLGYESWIGVIKYKGVWQNVDGSPLNYTNWYQGQATTVGCARLETDYNPKYAQAYSYWVDIDCTYAARAFVCKKPAIFD